MYDHRVQEQPFAACSAEIPRLRRESNAWTDGSGVLIVMGWAFARLLGVFIIRGRRFGRFCGASLSLGHTRSGRVSGLQNWGRFRLGFWRF